MHVFYHGRKFCSLPNVEAQPRGDCGRAVISDDMAGWGGVALSRIAGPIPALRCGDFRFGLFLIDAPAGPKSD
jgi:hypothetical protein